MTQIRAIASSINNDPNIISEGVTYKRVLSVLKHHLIFGGSDKQKTKKENELVTLFSRGVSMSEVIYAMIQDKCIGNIGSTYLKLLIGKSIRQLWPTQYNSIRRMLGMDVVEAKGKKEKVARSVRKRLPPRISR